MRFEIACWDLDGVIADSSHAIPTCINLALGEIGIAALPPLELRRFIGPPLLDTFRLVIEDAGGDAGLARGCVDAYRRHYSIESIRSTTVYPGIADLLARLQGTMRLIVVTSKPVDAAGPILAALGVREFFEGVYAPELDELEEPKSETLRQALLATGVTPGPGAVMIGDRLHDMIAGEANGLTTVGVLWGFGSREELEAERPDHIVESAAELDRVLSASRPASGASA